jgi:hypothetical protein
MHHTAQRNGTVLPGLAVGSSPLSAMGINRWCPTTFGKYKENVLQHSHRKICTGPGGIRLAGSSCGGISQTRPIRMSWTTWIPVRRPVVYPASMNLTPSELLLLRPAALAAGFRVGVAGGAGFAQTVPPRPSPASSTI